MGRQFAVLCAVMMIAAVLCTGCEKKQGGENTSSSGETSAEEAAAPQPGEKHQNEGLKDPENEKLPSADRIPESSQRPDPTPEKNEGENPADAAIPEMDRVPESNQGTDAAPEDMEVPELVPEPSRPEHKVPEIAVSPDQSDTLTEYEKYHNMTGEEQEKVFNSFESSEAFFEWYNQARKEYEDSKKEVIIDGKTDIQLIG